VRRIDRAVEIALRLRQARAEASRLEGEMDAVTQPRATAEERKLRDQLAQRVRWERFRAANAEHIAAYRKQWGAAHPEKEREYDRRQREKTKQDPRRLALYRATQERHRDKKNARKRQRLRDDPVYAEQERARVRQYMQRNYAAKFVPEGKRKCTLCRQPGHNRARCARVGLAQPAVHNNSILISGGGGALPVEGRLHPAPPPAEQGGRLTRYLQHQNTGGAGPARVAELRDQIARGVYVPFAELRAEFAGVARVPSVPCDWERERNRRRSLAEARRRERARGAPAEAAP